MSSQLAIGSALRQHMPYIDPSDEPLTYIDMNQAGISFLSPESEMPQTIFTDGLVGCTAVAIIGASSDGGKTAYLQHFHPEKHAEGQEKVETVLAVLRQCNAVMIAGVIYTPGKKHDLLRPQYNPQYPWAQNLIGAMAAKNAGRRDLVLLRTYRSPGTPHSMSVTIGPKKGASGIVIDKKVITRF